MLRFTCAFAGLTLSLLASNFAAAEIYKTVDKNGRVTYSDVPPPNSTAKPIELKAINTTPPPAAIPNSAPTDTTSGNSQEQQAYKVQLTAPANGTTLLADERSVTLSVSLNGNLQNGDLFAYKLDGSTLAKTTDFTYTLSEPPRGEHSLTVDVIDTEGNSIAQSDAITIVVMRPLPKQAPVPVPKK